jgi:predicted HTH transcriptional regulator
MTQFIIFLVIGTFGIVLGYYLATNRKVKKLRGIAVKQEQEKAENLTKIRAYLKNHDTVTNDDIENFLNISDATATNYLQYLENVGELRQVGTTGRSVHYERTP